MSSRGAIGEARFAAYGASLLRARFVPHFQRGVVVAEVAEAARVGGELYAMLRRYRNTVFIPDDGSPVGCSEARRI